MLFLAQTGSPNSFPYAPPTTAVWQARAGEAATLLATVPSYGGWYGGADLSPDGTKLAYVATGEFGRSAGLRVLDLATGATTTLDATGRTPRWSPTGDRVLYLSGPSSFGSAEGQPTVVSADGSGRRVLAASLTFSPGLSWSPDGAYVVGRDAVAQRLRVISVSDGASVRLRFVRPAGESPHLPPFGGSVDYYQPDWR